MSDLVNNKDKTSGMIPSFQGINPVLTKMLYIRASREAHGCGRRDKPGCAVMGIVIQ